MKRTILEGDRVFENKVAYDLKVPFTTWHLAQWGDPQRGEIAVFYSPHDGTRLVKRVIGLPGDTVELRYNRLVINGRPVDYAPAPENLFHHSPPGDRALQVFELERLPGQPHVVASIPGVLARRDFGPFQVPPGHYFMMGDNRDDSFDSRYFGPVPRSQILGRATTVVLSLDRRNGWIPRWSRFLTSLQKEG